MEMEFSDLHPLKSGKSLKNQSRSIFSKNTSSIDKPRQLWGKLYLLNTFRALFNMLEPLLGRYGHYFE